MATTADLFRAFDTKITLDEAARDTGLQRIIACTTALTAKYYPAGTSASDKVTLIGSLGKGTGINPIADADVMFHMPPGTWSRFTNYAGNGQSALLQEVRDVLKNRYPSTKIRGDGPVVVVSFTTAPTVEIVPTALVSDNANILYASGEVPVTRDGGQWEFVDYGAQLHTLDNADRPVAGRAYEKAEEVLGKKEGLTFTEAEIDRMLPAELRPSRPRAGTPVPPAPAPCQ